MMPTFPSAHRSDVGLLRIQIEMPTTDLHPLTGVLSRLPPLEKPIEIMGHHSLVSSQQHQVLECVPGKLYQTLPIGW